MSGSPALATLNQWIATTLLVLGAGVVGFALFFGFFAWMNDGPQAGLRLALTAGAFGAALALGGLGFRFAAGAHARGDGGRWVIQAAVVFGAWLAAGFAAWATSLVDKVLPPN